MLQGNGILRIISGYGSGANDGDIAAPITLGSITTAARAVDVRSNDALTNNGFVQSTGSGVAFVAVQDISAGRVSASTAADLTTTMGAIIDSNTTGADVTAPTATLAAATGIGSADAIETQVAFLSATNSGVSGNIAIIEADGVAVEALKQTGISSGTISLTTTTGGIGLSDGAVVSNGGLIMLTALTGSIIDFDVFTSTSIRNPNGQATLTAATGIGGGDAIDTRVATLSATNAGASGTINITEFDGLTVAALKQTGTSTGAVTLEATSGSIALNTARCSARAG